MLPDGGTETKVRERKEGEMVALCTMITIVTPDVEVGIDNTDCTIVRGRWCEGIVVV
jgi:hypothetical protein